MFTSFSDSKSNITGDLVPRFGKNPANWTTNLQFKRRLLQVTMRNQTLMQNLLDQQRLLFQLADLPKENFGPNQVVTYNINNTNNQDASKERRKKRFRTSEELGLRL